MTRTLLQALLFLPCIAHGAVTLAQIETFDTPTARQIGNPAFGIPSIRPNFGPNGTGDPALLTSISAGTGPTSRLIIFNTSYWAGNYTSAGVTALKMDLRNTSSGNLFIRIALNGPGGWFVTDGQSVNAGLGYATFLFDVQPSTLNPAKSNGTTLGSDANATLAGVSQVRILHSIAENSARGEVANATLRIDNITAVPEPRITLLMAFLLTFFLKRKR